MSASLVGSEMCIRDRALWLARTYLCSCAQRRSRASMHACVRQAWVHACAVSYTHLTLPTICSV
eukprot:8958441-Alexandrium_andersonii.AAC.1